MLIINNAPEAEELQSSSFSYRFERGHLFDYNSEAIRHSARLFYEEGRHDIEDYHVRNTPNPFIFQYDLELFLFLNYEELHALELKCLESNGDTARLDWVKQHGFTGLERHEHLFNAAAIRWPVHKETNGSLVGEFIRHPWVEDDWRGLCSHKFVLTFGGGGQGKTHGWLAFLAMVWDNFIKTDKGGKCTFSTVSEDKLKGATWPYLQRIYTVNQEDQFSLYAGTGKIVADYTIKRRGKREKDTSGVFKGILVGRQLDDQAIVDKFTGTHGHPIICALIDELQSTPEAPIKASSNFLSSPQWGWVVTAANYGTDFDTNGRNVPPKVGWENVNETTHIWESETTTGRNALVIHKNNDLSPASTSKYWANRCPFLPNLEKKAELFPTPAAMLTEGYRRFWIGWRDTENIYGYVIMAEQCKRSNSAEDFNPSEHKRIRSHFSFDSAPANRDRNILLHFQDGISREDGVWRWGINQFLSLPKASESSSYYRESTQAILERAEELNVKSGHMICDHSNMGGHPEFLADNNFETKILMYQEAPPDGKRICSSSGIIEPSAIALQRTVEDQTLITYAHQVVTDRISMGAYALRAYVRLGIVRGINKNAVAEITSLGLMGDFEQEFFRREIETHATATAGERERLKNKEEFRKKYGFSPDLLDTLFQAAYYCWTELGIPIDRVISSNPRNVDEFSDPEDDIEEQTESTNEQWAEQNLFDTFEIGAGEEVNLEAEAVEYDDLLI